MAETEAYIVAVPLVVGLLILIGLGDLRAVTETAVRTSGDVLHVVHVHAVALAQAAAAWLH